MTTTLDTQRRLAELGYQPGPLDGKNGPKTVAAVKAFQGAYGLVVDGIAGPQTIKALTQATTPAKPGKPEPDKSAMSVPAPPAGIEATRPAAPPNAASLKLLATARPIIEIIIHCAATPEGKDFTIADIRAWHKARGWSDIGYHYVVYRDGRVMEGRPVGQIGAHVAGHNTGTIGVCYIGGVTADGKRAKDTRTMAQRASLVWLVQQLAARREGIRKVTGHNQYAAKACPSFSVPQDTLGHLI